MPPVMGCLHNDMCVVSGGATIHVCTTFAQPVGLIFSSLVLLPHPFAFDGTECRKDAAPAQRHAFCPILVQLLKRYPMRERG